MAGVHIRHAWMGWMALAGMCAVGPVLAQSSQGSTSGETIFGTYCATCHGSSARGDGPLASSLSPQPANLTLIAQQNGGKFPAEQVARIIDGRNPVKGHGGGQMPVWGDAFERTIDGIPANEKIARLVSFLESVQAKP